MTPSGFFGGRVDRRIPNFQVPRPNVFFSRAIKKNQIFGETF